MRTKISHQLFVFYLIPVLAICFQPVFAANDRPLIFGQNPIPTDWWGYDPYTYDPLEFNKMQESGCTSCRQGVNWDQIERVRGTRDWSQADRWVKYALDRNIEVVMLINSTPTWALPEVNPEIPSPEARYPPREIYAEDFKSFVYECARRFRGRVQYYEFWNEANGYGWHWDGGFHRADEYTPWMKRAYEAIKLADPTARMSLTGIDDNGGAGDYFIRKVLDYGGKYYFDAVADHPYSPERLEEWKLYDVRATLDTWGLQNVDIWITEMGWPANGRESTVATWITDYFNKLVNNHPTVTIATYHTAMDFPWENVGYGLINKNLIPKVTWQAFKNYSKPPRPIISNITATPLSASSVRIAFTTNVATKGLVMYGPTDTYGFVTGRESTASINHQITLVGLSPGTTYHYRIRAGDGMYSDSVSADLTFTTPSGTAVLITSGPTSSTITETSAIITWTTNIPATATVEYGFDFSYGGTVSNSTMTTTHTLKIEGLVPGCKYQYRIISTAPGYADAAKEGTPFTTLPGTTWLVNGGFDDTGTGWTFWEVYPWGAGTGGQVANPGHISVYTDNGGAYVPNPPAMEGERRLTNDIGWRTGVGGLYQTLNVPNGQYVVSGWVASWCDGGSELVQLIAIDGPYTGGIPSGTNIASVSETTSWTFYSRIVNVATGKLTIATRVSQYYAVDVVSGHFDGIKVAPIVPGGIATLKSKPLGDPVATDASKVVTMVVDNKTFYIQEDNRCSGIKVRTSYPHGLAIGQKVSVAGTLRVLDGEALIDGAWVYATMAGTEPKPLGMTNSALGGGNSGVQPGIQGAFGLSNIGLLVTIWGKFRIVDSTHFTLDDGAEVVLCEVPSSIILNPSWQYVRATGISACRMENDTVKRLLRIRKASDLTVVK